MAQNKKPSQAEKAVRAKNRTDRNKKPVEKKTRDEAKIPFRLVSAAIFAILFILFVVMLLNPEGALVRLFYGFVLGLIGKIGFYISIPALLYLFFIHAFSKGRPILMRSLCLAFLVLCLGCISHLTLSPMELGSGLAYIGNLYAGGIGGATGGVICGLFGELFRLLLGPVIPYIALGIAAIFTLLGSMQITIPSLIRAFENRPRADWEEDPEDKPEPASIVVNLIANKRIQQMEKRRRAKEEKAAREKGAAEAADAEEAAVIDEPAPVKTRKPKEKAPDIMRQIDDIDNPVSAADKPVFSDPAAQRDEPMFETPTVPPQRLDDPKMPPLEMDEIQEPAAELPKEKVSAKDAAQSAAQVAAEIAENEAAPKAAYQYPPLDLLRLSAGGNVDATAEMRENAERLDDALQSFGVNAHIINVTRGPSVTRYEVELEKGVKLSRVTNVANDLALSLGVAGVRIATVVGKISVVGIEVPNKAVTTVSLREVIDSSEFANAKSKASFAVGKDIGGKCIVGNIAKLPHMLIAGTTGSGKSVCMNSIIISLLYKASPEEVKLIMIDPKMVELGVYNGIPHLLIPVVTDPKKAAGSLQWAVTEMMRRYKSMSDVGVRDLESYNAIMEAEEGQKMPQVVVIVDELADLMLVASKEVEESICRIAQMGRAAGIHLVIATQRPSSDVITGLMKANIPSRIAFSVASAMESRIILDTQGAEKLVGKGDMLFAPIGSGKPLRVQGCFVDESEVEAVASYVKQNFSSEYDHGVMEEIERKAAQAGNGKATASDPEPNAEELGGDEMLPAAVDVILETGQASVSMLQRRLKLGYARAARIVDEMEEKGIVGPFQGSKPRTILVTKEQWDSMRSGQPQQLGFEDLPDGSDPIGEDEEE